MNATDLKSLLYDYLAILRSPGGAEKIGFAIEQHLKRLDLLEIYRCGPIKLRDLPRYEEPMPRTLEELEDKPFSHTEPFPKG